MEGNLIDHKDVRGLATALNIHHNREEWRLFIDSPKLNLKALLFHNGKVLPSITVRYAVNKKESYNKMKLLINCISYMKYK
jgi:arabinogalactan endo-1,4-beta-galactosidase